MDLHGSPSSLRTGGALGGRYTPAGSHPRMSKVLRFLNLLIFLYFYNFLYPYLNSIPELDSSGRLNDTKNTTGAWSSSVRQRSLLQSTVWQLHGPGDPQQWFTVGSLVHFWCPSYHITYHINVHLWWTYLTISCHQNHHCIDCIDHPAISSNSISLEKHGKCMAPAGPCGLALGFDISDQLFQLILREFLHPLLQLWLGAWALPLPPNIRSQLGIIIQGPNETGLWIMFEINNDQINDYLANRTLQTYMKPLWLSVVSLP